MTYEQQSVIHCIELMGLRNPGKLTKTESGGYIHTTTRGRSRLFTPYGTNVYFSKCRCDKNFRALKMHHVMSHYITEEDYVE